MTCRVGGHVEGKEGALLVVGIELPALGVVELDHVVIGLAHFDGQ